MKIKTTHLIDIALDWATLNALHPNLKPLPPMFKLDRDVGRFHYSTDWSQGGSILEREKIDMVYRPDIDCIKGEVFPRWIASVVTHGAEGSAPLIAAMRCFCCSKFGDVVDIPEELFY